MAFNFLTTLEWQDDFFDDIKLPPGLVANKALLIDTIIDKAALLAPYYGNPRLFKKMSDHFFAKNFENFKKQWELLQLEYNPIENYDRWEDSDGEDHGTSSSNGTAEDTISAMNSGSYQPDSKSVSSGGAKADSTNKFHSHIHGNIGVTTTQEMIMAERRLLEFNIYAYIADMYINEFFIRVY